MTRRIFLKVRFDVDRLAEDLDEAFELLSKGASRVDECGKTYSPDRLELNSDKQRKDSFINGPESGFV